MTWDDGKDNDENGGDEDTKRLDPYRSHPNQTLDVFFANSDIVHRRGRFGLLKQSEEGREGIVRRE